MARAHARRLGGRSSLLKDMRQFMEDQAATVRTARVVLAGPENDVRAEGVCIGVDQSGRVSGSLIGVDTYAAEVVPEALGRECTHLCINWLTGGAKDGLNRRVDGSYRLRADPAIGEQRTTALPYGQQRSRG